MNTYCLSTPTEVTTSSASAMVPLDHEPVHQNKRRKYMSHWESRLFELPQQQQQKEQHGSLSTNASSTCTGDDSGGGGGGSRCTGSGLSLEDLFPAGNQRWHRTNNTSKQSKSQQRQQHQRQTQPPCLFRLEHRQGGQLAQHDGEERILLFRSDRKGAIAKIVFSSSPPSDTSTNVDDTTDNNDVSNTDNDAHMAHAKIHVLDVKDVYRGYDLGGLLFKEALSVLQRKSYGGHCHSCRCVLDAEEDASRHNKLVGFYERLGAHVKPNTKPQFLNHNDGETYRKVPMLIDLLLKKNNKKKNDAAADHAHNNSSSCCCCSHFQQQKHDDTKLEGFLPVRLLLGSTLNNNSNSGQHCYQYHKQQAFWSKSVANQGERVDWVMVQHHQFSPGNSTSTSNGTSIITVQFRTTHGLVLTVDEEGHCRQEEEDHCDTNSHQSSMFQLYRVSDNDENENESEHAQWHGKELWLLKPLTNTPLFLKLDPRTLHLEASKTPTFWQAHSDTMSLTCTFDTPARRRHYRKAWIKQTVDYVKQQKLYYTNFQLAKLSLEDALLHLSKLQQAFPFMVDANVQHLSVRNLCFRTAEAARAAGHPDWIQFIALVHALGSVVNCLDAKTGQESDDDFDWTILCTSRVLGCASPEGSTFSEFQSLNADLFEEQYNTRQGIYGPHHSGGLQNTILAWTGPEYLASMLHYNQVMDLPDEAYAVLRLFLLKDWHAKHLYAELASDDDREVLSFVVEFDALRWKATRDSLGQAELTTEECQHLWDSRYANIAAKFGADRELRW